jgi:hypothetical protein
MERGKIYKVKRHCYNEHDSIQRAVTKEGWLWLHTGARDKTSLKPLLTSVATGAKCWFNEDELEAADGEG